MIQAASADSRASAASATFNQFAARDELGRVEVQEFHKAAEVPIQTCVTGFLDGTTRQTPSHKSLLSAKPSVPR